MLDNLANLAEQLKFEDAVRRGKFYPFKVCVGGGTEINAEEG